MLPYVKGLYGLGIVLWLVDAVINAVNGDTVMMLVCLGVAALTFLVFTQLGKILDD